MKSVLLTVLIASELIAAFESSSFNAFTAGTSNSGVATDHLFSAYLLNPAISAGIADSHLGLTYFRPYGLEGVEQAELILNTLAGSNGLGLALSTFGNRIYRENRLTLNLSRRILNGSLALGLNAHYYNVAVEGYGSAHTVGFDAGMQYSLSSAVFMGFSVRNINQPALNGYSEELPLVTTVGMMVKFAERLRGFVSLQKDAWFPFNVLFGIDYQASDFLSVQSGFMTEPSVPSLGLSVQKGWIALNYVFRHHFDLGSTHLWGISLTKGNE